MPDEDHFRLLTHHPKGLDGDFLEYKDYADTIFKVLQELGPDDTGITIGVFGDWGIGKSTILRMVKAQLEDDNAKGNFLIVEFDAWRYVRQEDLWLTFLRKMLVEINKQLGLGSLLWVNWELWRKRLKVSAIINLIWETIRLLLSPLTGRINVSLPNIPAPSGLNFGRGKSITIDDFRDDFQTIIQTVAKPLVVLIDDLDRCPDNQIVPVLEAIKHFGFEEPLVQRPHKLTQSLQNSLDGYLFNIEGGIKKSSFGIAFVLAADRRAIERAVSAHYQGSQQLERKAAEEFAREYVEKIVQVPFELPPLRRVHLSRHLQLESQTRPTTGGQPSSSAVGLPTLQEACERALSILVHGPKRNPRAIRQAFNTFQTRWRIVVHRQLGFVIPELLAVVLLLQYAWPDEFADIFENPLILFYLHALTKNSPNNYCTLTEIEELYDLGLPDRESPLARFRDLELRRLLRALSLTDSLSVENLILHLTLVSLPETYVVRTDEPWKALTSGDPARIKATADISSNLGDLLLGQLGNLAERAHRVDDEFPQLKEDDEVAQQAIRALFALGRARFGRIIDRNIIRIIEEDLMSKSNQLPMAVLLRAVYTLGHHASDPQRESSELACSVLLNIVKDSQKSNVIRARAVRMLGHYG